MRADNSRHLAKAARSRAEQTRRRAVSTLRHLATTEQTITVSVLLSPGFQLLDSISFQPPRRCTMTGFASEPCA